jgi:two-component system phosphate regulon response regulator PhoB
MAKELILIVDDEPDILELMEFNLLRHGFSPVCVATGEDALKSIARQRPALVLLDLMLPGIDGLDVCRRLKGDPTTESIPIVMVSAKGEESDVVEGLELGADDYIVKPFSPRVLVARVKTALRRTDDAGDATERVLKMNGIVLDPTRRDVVVDGEQVVLTRTEFELLSMLLKRPGRVFTRGQIIDAVRGEDYAVTERSVDVQVVGLRRKLGIHGELVETVRGVGYRLRDLNLFPDR